ncbi:protein OS-9-like isoform X1 [Tubulanus polymorphus]|uniref:protein OS-9-like isoform X1 n=1 Tax=Tubulanus polymorphus TaxID=672921 RepID=UPI003DA56260
MMCPRLAVFLLFLVDIPTSFAFLDIEELKNLKYGIELLKVPVDSSQVPLGSPDVLALSSKHGQQYRCILPNSGTNDLKEKEEEKLAQELGIPDLLKPLEQGPCLIFTKDWWTYEFCYGRYVQQYHLEDGRPSGQIIKLGVYESEYDWNNDESAKEKKERLNRYHSQQYVNGSMCDLNSKPRRTEVRFECEEGIGDHIASIVEPESCGYVLTVHTTKICHHPYLKPSKTKKVLVITCNPMLEHEQYEQYLKAKEAERIRMEQLREAKYKYLKEANEARVKLMEENQKDAGDPYKNIKDSMIHSLKQGLKETMKLKNAGASPDESSEQKLEDLADKDSESKVKIEMKTIRTPEELHSYMKEVRETIAKRKRLLEKEEEAALERKKQKIAEDISHAETESKSSKKSEQTRQPEGDDSLPAGDSLKESIEGESSRSVSESEKLDVDESDKQFSRELKESMESMMKRDDKSMEMMKTKLRDTMTAQFRDIMKEVEDQMAVEGINNPELLDKKESLKQLASSLSDLLVKLERSNQELEEIDEKLRSALHRIHPPSVEGDEDALDKPTPPAGGSEIEPGSGDQQQITPTDGADVDGDSLTNPDDSSNLIKVRVMKIKHTDPDAPQRDTTKADGSPGSGGDVEIEEEQRKRLESSVREELKKAGFNANQNIQIKVISTLPAGHDKLTSFTDDDSLALNKMIISILGGNQDEAEELKRQQELENGYNFKWTSANSQQSVNEEQSEEKTVDEV